MELNRRLFLMKAAYSPVAIALAREALAQTHDMSHTQHSHPKPERPAVPRLPALICKVTGTIGTDAAYKLLASGSDPLDAALHLCTTQENDEKDHSNGLGGLPNAGGEVQLDACCLHGPSGRAAAVASVRNIRNASLLAKALMDHTGSALMAGTDAEQFALAHGFLREDLLTDRTRNNFALWKTLQAQPAKPPPASQEGFDRLIRDLEPVAAQAGLAPDATWRAALDAIAPRAEPLYVSTIDRHGQMAAACTSSGTPWQQPGLASDVAILGTGCFLDPGVGSAGSSGTAEANTRIAGAHTIVENMHMGMSPEEAGLEALRRIVHTYKNNMAALQSVEIVFYILRKDGVYGSVSLWRGDRTGHTRQFTIQDAEFVRRTEDCSFLFDCGPMNPCSNLTAGKPT